MSNRKSRVSRAMRLVRRSLAVKIILVFAVGFIVIGAPAILQAQNPAPAPGATAPSAEETATAPSAASPSDEYMINPGDVLEVYVYTVPELSHNYIVSPSGYVHVPLLPTPLPAAGLTLDQFASAMEEAFRQSGRLRRPEIAVSLAKPSPASTVAVEGAVRNPSILSQIGRIRLVDIITQCGGLSDDAGDIVTITRGPLALRDLAAEGGTATPILTLELKKVMDVNDSATNTGVWPGDRVSVERARVEFYYVMGEVRAPGGYNLRKGQEELTVLRALALAGDSTSVAKKSKAMIIRKDPKGPQGRDEIKLDLKSILLGKSPDPKLQADDILFVPGSNGKKALHTLTSVPAQVAGEAAATAVIVH